MSINNLHEPSSTSPNPSTSTATNNFATDGSHLPTVQSEAIRLTELKDEITNRLDIYFEVLKSNNATMQTNLVDPEGFPRSDIDVAAIRTARSQINRLRNDLKDVIGSMSNLLERGLPNVGSVVEDVVMNGNGASTEGEETVESGGSNLGSFAKVDGVFPNSPADIAGLKRNDTIISIGSVNASNHDSLKGVAALVNASEGVTLPLVISRPTSTETEETQILHLRLTPKTGWGGRGLLGCHIVIIR